MMRPKRGRVDLPFDEYADIPVPLAEDLPAEIRVPVPKGLVPPGQTGVKHGYHMSGSIEVPTSLMCNVCPLYHVKRKDRRHPLSCKHGKKNQTCPVLCARQVTWAAEFISEVKDVTGESPTASDRARIEQIIRHRSRIFQVENYLKVAGLIDLTKGTIRNVGERLTTLENALSRSLSEFRQALAERREVQPQAPRLEEYLKVKGGEDDSGQEDD